MRDIERLSVIHCEWLRIGMMLSRPINQNKLPAELTWASEV